MNSGSQLTISLLEHDQWRKLITISMAEERATVCPFLWPLVLVIRIIYSPWRLFVEIERGTMSNLCILWSIYISPERSHILLDEGVDTLSVKKPDLGLAVSWYLLGVIGASLDSNIVPLLPTTEPHLAGLEVWWDILAHPHNLYGFLTNVFVADNSSGSSFAQQTFQNSLIKPSLH